MTQDASTMPTPEEEWVREQLRSLPQLEMPANVAARITEALRTEQAAQLAGNVSAIGASPTGGTSHTGEPESGVAVDHNPRRGWWSGLAVAASVAMALMLIAWAPWQSAPDAYERVLALNTVRPVSTDTNYTAANIEQAVSANLSSMTARASNVPLASDSQRKGSFAANDEVMASCLAGLGTAASNVRLIDLAEYQGQPSGIVVYGDGEGNLVVVVAPRCGRDDPGVRMRLSSQSINNPAP